MSITVINRTYAAPPVNEREILRYAGCREEDDATLSLLRDALGEAEPQLSYRVCYATFPLVISDGVCDFGCFHIKSQALSKNLSDCESAVLFAATIGIPFDRLIAKYSKLSPARAIMLQAIGSERVEALCDAFCRELETEKCKSLRPRFSPGYGDLPLEVQKDIFSVLNVPKNLSVFLTESSLMSPSKSVTAFIGIRK